MRILVADDDPVARYLVEATLQSLGHKVYSCSDGDGALEASQSFEPEIVVSDWKMPGINGIELCRRLRGQKSSRVYFILVSSALTSTENQDQAREAGVDVFIKKPFAPEDIWRNIRMAEGSVVHHLPRSRLSF